MNNIDIATLAIIGANVLFSYKGFSDGSLFNKYKFQIGAIKNGEFIRMLSSGFLHADGSHLFFNMFTLYFFAPVLTQFLGVPVFIAIYFIGLFGGNALSFLYHKNNDYYSAIGASGAVSAVLFSSILLIPNQTLLLMAVIPIKAYVFGIGYLAYTVFGMKKQLGNIGHSAHLGGAITGLIITIIIRPVLLQTEYKLIIMMAIPILVFLLFGNKLTDKFSK
jgi:membrane associated rhomboid family serine protease